MKAKKKKLGQFFTSPIIARFMTDLVITSKTEKVLDPAVGMGVFTREVNKNNKNVSITACEIDPEMIRGFKNENKYPCELFEQDYLTTCFDEPFDAIICNPPYNKFQEIPNRDRLIAEFKQKYGISMSGYSNLCVYFIIKSLAELKKYGKCCYIIPYEFMNTGYGVAIKQYFLKSKMLKAIYKFSNTLSLFDEAITTSCIVLFENKKRSHVEFVNIDDIEELKTGVFSCMKNYDYFELVPEEKWLQYFDFVNDKKKYSNMVKVSTFGKVSRGIATGANNYFAINKTIIKEHGLSESVCLPCLTKASDVTDVIFTKKSFSFLEKQNKKVYLFDGTKSRTDQDKAYIALGVKLGVNKAYLTSHRNPWYSIENKKAAQILICVFSREKIKIIRNEAKINNLTTFHGLHLKTDDSEFANILFCYLLTPLAQELLYLTRREYGDGLTKFEPNDLSKADMLDLRIISSEDKKTILEIYEIMKAENKEVMIEELDAIFRKYTNVQNPVGNESILI